MGTSAQIVWHCCRSEREQLCPVTLRIINFFWKFFGLEIGFVYLEKAASFRSKESRGNRDLAVCRQRVLKLAISSEHWKESDSCYGCFPSGIAMEIADFMSNFDSAFKGVRGWIRSRPATPQALTMYAEKPQSVPTVRNLIILRAYSYFTNHRIISKKGIRYTSSLERYFASIMIMQQDDNNDEPEKSNPQSLP